MRQVTPNHYWPSSFEVAINLSRFVLWLIWRVCHHGHKIINSDQFIWASLKCVDCSIRACPEQEYFGPNSIQSFWTKKANITKCHLSYCRTNPMTLQECQVYFRLAYFAFPYDHGVHGTGIAWPNPMSCVWFVNQITTESLKFRNITLMSPNVIVLYIIMHKILLEDLVLWKKSVKTNCSWKRNPNKTKYKWRKLRKST